MATPAKKETDKSVATAPYQAPRGMRDLIGDEWFRYQGFMEKAAEVALYYGFQPIELPILEQENVFVHGTGETSDVVTKEMYALRTKGGDHLALRPEGTPNTMRAYLEHGMQSLPQPVQLYYHGPLFRHDKPQRGRYRQFYTFGCEVIGSDKAVNDVMLMQVIASILTEVGLKDFSFEVNSLGDKECRVAYKKALIAYYRKFQSELSAHSKELLKDNPLRILDSKEPREVELSLEAPASIDYLTGPAKSHFKEVLDYLEALGLPYRMNNRIVRGLDYYNRTVFEIIANPPEAEESGIGNQPSQERGPAMAGESGQANPPSQPLALGGGGRYDYLGRVMGSKRDIPAVGFGLGVDRIVEICNKDISPRIVKKPKFYFIQLGAEAKMRSLQVVEVLREAKVPIMHSLAKDSLGAQLAKAEELGIPYVIILGQKEVMEKSVIVRDMKTRSQDSIRVDALADYLKKLK